MKEDDFIIHIYKIIIMVMSWQKGIFFILLMDGTFVFKFNQ